MRKLLRSFCPVLYKAMALTIFFSLPFLTSGAKTLPMANRTSRIFTHRTPGLRVLSINRASANPSNATSVNFTVTFSAPVTSVDAGDFTVTTTGATGKVKNVSGSGDTYSILVDSVSGNGTLRLDLKAGTDVQDVGGHIAAAYTGGQAYTVDHTAPFMASYSYLSNNNTSHKQAQVGDVITFNVTFDAPIQQAPVITIGGISVAPVNTSGNAWVSTYTLTSADVEGSFPFDIMVTDLAGNTSEITSATVGASVYFDKTRPTIAIGSPSATAAKSGPVSYIITYSDANFYTANTGVGDITLNTTGTATGTIDVVNSDNTSTVTISNITGDGTLGISVGAGTGQDYSGNTAPAAGPSETFLVDNTAPTGFMVRMGASPTNAVIVDFLVNFSEEVTGVDAADFSIPTMGSASGSVFGITGSGNSYIVRVATTGTGSLGLNLNGSGTGIHDAAGNTAAGFTGPTYAIDHTPPSFSPGSGTWQSNNAQPGWAKVGDELTLKFGFTESVTTPVVTIGGHTVTATSVDGGLNWEASYTMTSGDTDGNVYLTFQGTDPAGNFGPLYTAGIFAQGIVFDATPPTATISRPSATFANSGPVSYTITYNDANFSAATTNVGDITLNSTGTATGTVGVVNSGNTSTVTISNITGDGSLGISVAASTGRDNSGNTTPAAGPSATFLVDNIVPTVTITRASLNPTKETSVDFIVNFSEDVTGVDAADFTIATTGSALGSISAISAINSSSTYRVTINVSGDGNLGLNLNGSGTGIQDAGGNAVAGFTGQVFAIDHTRPQLQAGNVIWQSNNARPNWAKVGDEAHLHIAFDEAVRTSEVYINGHSVTATSPDGGVSWDAYYVLTPADEEGNVHFNFRGTDFAGNASLFYDSGVLGLNLFFNETPPTVAIGSPSATFANSGPVSYTITYGDVSFAGATTTAGDITLNSTGTATGTVDIVNSGNTSTVTISNITGDGSLGISVAAGTGQDYAGNLAPAAGPSATFLVDNVVPTVAITRVGASPTKATSLDFTVTFSEDVTGVDVSDFAFATTDSANGTITAISGSGTTYTVTVSVSGDGNLGLNLKGSGTGIVDAGGNTVAGFTGETYTIDHTAPQFQSGTGIWQSNNALFSWAKVGDDIYLHIGYTEAVQTDVVTINGHTIAATSPDGGVSWDAHYVLTSGDAEGNVPFTFRGTDFAGNIGTLYSSAPFGLTLIFDATPPTVTISSPSAAATSSGPVSYTITYGDVSFAGATTTAGDITLNATGTATGTIGVVNSSTTSTVTISNITGNGTLGISVGAGTGHDAAGNTTPAAGPSGTFLVDNIVPTVAITRVGASMTKATSLDFKVTFSEDVTGVDASDFSLATTDSALGTISAITGNGANYTVTVTGVSGDGNLGLNLNGSGTGIMDADNAVAGVTGEVYIVDHTAPQFQSGTGVWYSNNAQPSWAKVGDDVYLHIAYTEAVQTDEVTINGHTITATSPDGGFSWDAHYVLTSGDAEGNVPFTFRGTDFAGNTGPLYSSGSFGLTLIFDATPPSVTISSPSQASIGLPSAGSVTYNIAYADANFGASTLSAGDITLNRTGTANGTMALTGSGTSYTLTISNITGVGTLGISIGTGTAFDFPGNLAAAAGPSATFNVVSTNALLTTLTLSPATTLLKVTGTDYADYTTNVSNSTGSVQVIPVAADIAAMITVNGLPATSGVPSSPITLNADTTAIAVTVTAGDGTTKKTYRIAINRLPKGNALLKTLSLSPTTALTKVTGPDYANYNATVVGSVTSLKVIALAADNTSIITVNGVLTASGAQSAPVTLNADTTTIAVTITAANGISKLTYRILVNRTYSAILSSLTLSPATTLTKVTGPDYADYTATVINSVSSLKVIPVTADNTATLTINGVAATSGLQSVPITLNADTTAIAVTVTTGDGITKNTYRIVVHRLPSTNAILKSIALNPTTKLNKVTGPDYSDYTASVASTVHSVKVIPVTADNTATVTVNGVAATSGVESGPVALHADTTAIAVTITAGDGVTKLTYRIVVTRTPSNNAILKSIALSPTSKLTKVTGPDYTNYTASVPSSTSSLQMIAVTADNGATITVNGVTTASGATSAAVTLHADTTTIATTVTAEDGVTKKSYVVLVTRLAPPPNAIVYDQPKEAPITSIDIVVHQNVSPNGDGNSDVLQIDGITAYPDNKLQIMSRSGNLVYDVRGYDNTSKVFDGHATDGKLQQAGTYFYSLEYKDGNEMKRKTGFIVLKY